MLFRVVYYTGEEAHDHLEIFAADSQEGFKESLEAWKQQYPEHIVTSGIQIKEFRAAATTFIENTPENRRKIQEQEMLKQELHLINTAIQAAKQGISEITNHS